jgi:hypothetical protein
MLLEGFLRCSAVLIACTVSEEIVQPHGLVCTVVTKENHEWPRVANPPINQNRYIVEIRDLIKAYKKIRNAKTYSLLQLDLIDHIWDMHGNDANGGSHIPW